MISIYNNNFFIRNQSQHPLLDNKHSVENQKDQIELDIHLSSFAYLKDHQVFDQIIFPATAYLELALAMGYAFYESKSWSIKHFSIQQAFLFVSDGLPLRVISTLQTSQTSTPYVMSIVFDDQENLMFFY